MIIKVNLSFFSKIRYKFTAGRTRSSPAGCFVYSGFYPVVKNCSYRSKAFTNLFSIVAS